MENISLVQHVPWTFMLRVIAVSAVSAYFAYRLYGWHKFASVVNKIPSMKLRYWHLLGHIQASIYMRLKNLPLSVHIYDFMVVTGICLIHMKKGMLNFWAINHPLVNIYKADAVEVILNHSTQIDKAWFYKFTHPWLGQGLLTSSGKKWRNRRKLLTPAFHFNILQDFLIIFNSKAKIFAEVLNNHTKDEFINIVSYVTRCSLDVICDSILGIDMHVQTESSNPYVESVNFLTGAIAERMHNPFVYPDFFFKISRNGRKFFRHLKLVQDFTLKLIKEKKAKLVLNSKVFSVPLKDDECLSRKKRAFLDLLLDEHINNNALSEKEIMEEVDTFTFEGHDTTAMGMSFALYLIGLHPGHQEKIHQELDTIFGEDNRDATMDDLKEMKYLDCVLKEALRLFPPVPTFGRLLNEDIEIEGRVIPNGCTCLIFPYVLHRDPVYFPNPEKFDPDRFLPENCSGRHPFAYVPFSAGPRNCIGQKFALMEEKVVISTILRKFKIRSLDPRDKVHMINAIVLRPVDGLRLEIRLRDYVPEKPPVYYHYP